MGSEVDVAWAAGLFEGEGSAFIGSGQRQPCVALAMTDEDVVARFASIMGVGNVRSYHRPPNKRYWQWTAQSRNDVIAALEALLPHLGARRTRAALTVLARAAEMRSLTGERTHCNRGHAFSDPGNLYIHTKSGKRHCRQCRIEYGQRRRVPRQNA